MATYIPPKKKLKFYHAMLNLHLTLSKLTKPHMKTCSQIQKHSLIDYKNPSSK